MTDEEWVTFNTCHFGYEAVPTGDSRDCYVPLLLPNSGYALRAGFSTRGLGVWPADLGSSNRLEIQVSLYPSEYCTADINNVPASINTACAICMREVKMSSGNYSNYKSARGQYSTVSRRFTPLTVGWTACSANVKKIFNFNQPSGSVTELQILAVPTHASDNTRRDYMEAVQPIQMKLICDSIVVRDFNRPIKMKLHNYQGGFVHGTHMNPIGRISFASHGSESSHKFSGAFNFSNISQIRLEVTFGEAVDCQVVAVQLQSTQIDSAGVVTSYLD